MVVWVIGGGDAGEEQLERTICSTSKNRGEGCVAGEHKRGVKGESEGAEEGKERWKELKKENRRCEGMAVIGMQKASMEKI
jgi:hypothetical protein